MSNRLLLLGAGAPSLFNQVLALNPPVLFDPSQPDSCFQERTGASATTPSGADGVIGSLKNFGTLGGWAIAPSDAARPLLRLSGTQARIEFDGVDDALDFTTITGVDAVFQNVGAGTLAGAHKFRSSPTTTEVIGIFTINGSSSSSRALLAGGTTSGKYTSLGRRLDADSAGSVNSTAAISTTTPVTHIAEFDWTNSNLNQYINNSVDGSTTTFQTDGSTSNTASTTCRLGATGAGSLFADVDLYAFFAKAAFVDRAVLHAYLASRAGI